MAYIVSSKVLEFNKTIKWFALMEKSFLKKLPSRDCYEIQTNIAIKWSASYE